MPIPCPANGDKRKMGAETGWFSTLSLPREFDKREKGRRGEQAHAPKEITLRVLRNQGYGRGRAQVKVECDPVYASGG